MQFMATPESLERIGFWSGPLAGSLNSTAFFCIKQEAAINRSGKAAANNNNTNNMIFEYIVFFLS
ncbi:MAG TPA: hypothetical protein H9674_09720 [Firmicutes bacterium]|nr:hypothetical protein [Bacillota bacterium]